MIFFHQFYHLSHKWTNESSSLWRRPLTWIEERGPGLGRAKHIHFRFQDASITKLPAGQREPVGLFMQDLLLFGRKLQGEVSAAELQEEKSRILHCLQLADRIQQLSENTPAWTWSWPHNNPYRQSRVRIIQYRDWFSTVKTLWPEPEAGHTITHIDRVELE